MSTLVGLDVGTSGVKALAVSETGDVLARSEVGYGLSTPRPGWAEQDPADWWSATEQALAALEVRDVARAELLERLLRPAPPVLGILLGPPGLRRREPVADLRAAHDLAVLRHRERLHSAGPHVEPDRHAHATGASSATLRPDSAEA